jgi:hypothetical protein
MNTRLIMSLTSMSMGLSGLLLTFLPQEAANAFGWALGNTIVLQIMGALYFGFAMLNWMSKANLIGGIYNRPLAVGNATHFFIGALALIKFSPKTPLLVGLAITYSILAIAFGYILFTHPVRESKTE